MKTEIDMRLLSIDIEFLYTLGALTHFLQSQNLPPGGPKRADRVGKGLPLDFLVTPINSHWISYGFEHSFYEKVDGRGEKQEGRIKN